MNYVKLFQVYFKIFYFVSLFFATKRNNMKVKINDRFYYSFDAVTINYKLDSVASAFSFKARFNPDNQFHKEIFKPLQYQKVEIFDNEDNLKLTGNILNTSLSSGSSRELQTISGYSKSGIIEDVNIPFSAYPLEKNNVSLNDIVRDVLMIGLLLALLNQ